MSIALMSAVWPMQLQSGAKLVLLALADNANDNGQCWPGIATLIEKTCLSERAIQSHIRDLAVSGHLTIHERSGRSNVYTLTPAVSAPPQKMPPAKSAPTPATVAPPPPQILHPEPKDEPSRTRERARERAARLPDDFELTETRKATARAEGLDANRTFADFCDHWRSAGGERARKLDWDAAWRLWCRRERDFKPNAPRGTQPSDSDALRKLADRRSAIGLPDFRDPRQGESADDYRNAQDAEYKRRQTSRAAPKFAAELAQQKRIA